MTRVVLIMLFVMMESVSVGAQAGATLPDSSALSKNARTSVGQFERVAQRFVAPTADRVMRTSGGRFEPLPSVSFGSIAGGSLPAVRRCNASDGGICIAGRLLPCFGCGYSAVRPEEYSIAAETVIRELEAAFTTLPGDRFISGQLAYLYVHIMGDHSGAVSVADRCRAVSPVGWCGMLRVYALHEAGDHGEASRALERTLESMDSAWRCKWLDMALLLRQREVRERYASLSCDARQPWERMLWWLSDPNVLIPGNDRRTAHASRRVFQAIYEDWRYGEPRWLADEELPVFSDVITLTAADTLIASGWYNSWTRPAGTSLVGYAADDPRAEAQRVTRGAGEPYARTDQLGYHFLPDDSVVSCGVACVTPEAWTMLMVSEPPFVGHRGAFAIGFGRSGGTVATPPAEAYMPSYGPAFDLSALQVARFPRAGGDSLLVVAATATQSDTVIARILSEADSVLDRIESHEGTRPANAWQAGLYVSASPDPAHEQLVTVAGELRSKYVLELMSTMQKSLGAAEILGPGPRGLFRSRFRIDPVPDSAGFSISDILVFAPENEAGASAEGTRTTLDAVKPLMYGTTVLDRDTETIGFYWELMGAATDSVTWSLRTTRTDGGFIGSIGRLFGIGRRGASSIVWQEYLAPGRGTAAQGRTINISVGDLPSGTYEFTLTARRPDGTSISTNRLLQIAP